MARSKFISITISICLTIILFTLIFLQLDFTQFKNTFIKIDIKWVLFGIFFSQIYQIFRTFRFSILTNIKNIGRLFTTLCLQAVVRKFFPSWLGEAVAVLFLKRYHRLSIHRSTASVFVARMIDLSLFALALLYALTLTTVGYEYDYTEITSLILIFLATGCIGIVIIIRLESHFLKMSSKHSKIRAWLASQFAALSVGFRETINIKAVLPLAFYSTLMWLSMYLMFLCFIRALGGNLSPLDIFWSYSIVFPLGLLPIRGIADIGTFEAAWFIALTILGLSSSQAASIAVGTHILVFIPVGIYFILGFIGLKYYALKDRIKER